MPYLEIYLALNIENLKSFDPSMLDDESSEMLSSIEDSVINQEKPLEEDTIIEKKSTTAWWGIKVIFRIGYKGQTPSVARWFSEEAIEIEFL